MAKKLKILNKLKKENIPYFEYKKRFLLVVIGLFLLIVLAIYLLQIAYASYQSQAKLVADINKAIYLIKPSGMDFNIDLNKIEPSSKPYIYKFSISNFEGNKHSEVDIEYQLNIRTTTNLPLTFELYRNENYDDAGATNLFNQATTTQDVDGAWYNYLEGKEKHQFLYSEDETDIYTLVVYFPENHKLATDYADNIENIEVEIISNQIVD